ncbi:MAG: hypothetical protein ACOH2K_12205 [Burkholderiaceae bacterium]
MALKLHFFRIISLPRAFLPQLQQNKLQRPYFHPVRHPVILLAGLSACQKPEGPA